MKLPEEANPETGNRLVVSSSWGEIGMGSEHFMEISFWGDETFWS